MGDRINVNDILHPGDERRSENGQYRLFLQHDSNFVLYRVHDEDNQEPLWASNTYTEDESSDNKSVLLQADGNFVMYNADGQPIWASESTDYGAVSPFILVQSDGNVVLYDEEVEGAHWSTDTYQG